MAGLLMCAFFFYFDITQPLGVAAGATYVAAVAIGLVAQSRWLVAWFGGLGTLLTILGFFTSHPASSVSASTIILNRGLSIFALLTATITGYVMLKRQEKFDARLIELASVDALTGLLNRRTLMSLAERRVQEARRYNQSLSIMMLDIDHFKRINDKHGHLEGDKVLKAVAAVAVSSSRRTDYVGRYGGEEFLLVCPSVDAEQAYTLAERIRLATENLQNERGLVTSEITVSIGIAEMVSPETTLRELVGAADRAMYQAKAEGRNRVVIDAHDDAPLLKHAQEDVS